MNSGLCSKQATSVCGGCGPSVCCLCYLSLVATVAVKGWSCDQQVDEDVGVFGSVNSTLQYCNVQLDLTMLVVVSLPLLAIHALSVMRWHSTKSRIKTRMLSE